MSSSSLVDADLSSLVDEDLDGPGRIGTNSASAARDAAVLGDTLRRFGAGSSSSDPVSGLLFLRWCILTRSAMCERCILEMRSGYGVGRSFIRSPYNNCSYKKVSTLFLRAKRMRYSILSVECVTVAIMIVMLTSAFVHGLPLFSYPSPSFLDLFGILNAVGAKV